MLSTKAVDSRWSSMLFEGTSQKGFDFYFSSVVHENFLETEVARRFKEGLKLPEGVDHVVKNIPKLFFGEAFSPFDPRLHFFLEHDIVGLIIKLG